MVARSIRGLGTIEQGGVTEVPEADISLLPASMSNDTGLGRSGHGNSIALGKRSDSMTPFGSVPSFIEGVAEADKHGCISY